ncbi:NAD(P)-dependent oxidoreductase [Streptomyces sp. NPDC086010]|uniref:NAD(P)-dependent oxidoreductase n=1 Tax=Streptomyces sp. NPDC086010 TaxID=3365745 RepID=UPI0037D363CB
MRELLDDGGLLTAITPGTIIVNHGTGDPTEAERIAAHVHAAGGAFLDVPVSGGGPGARARTLTTFAGPAEVFEATCPVLAALSDTVRLMAPAGAGQLTKLFNNALTITNMKNIEDVLTLAGQVGLDLPALIDVIGGSRGGAPPLRGLGQDINPALAEVPRAPRAGRVHRRADRSRLADLARRAGQPGHGRVRRAGVGALGRAGACTRRCGCCRGVPGPRSRADPRRGLPPRPGAGGRAGSPRGRDPGHRATVALHRRGRSPRRRAPRGHTDLLRARIAFTLDRGDKAFPCYSGPPGNLNRTTFRWPATRIWKRLTRRCSQRRTQPATVNSPPRRQRGRGRPLRRADWRPGRAGRPGAPR